MRFLLKTSLLIWAISYSCVAWSWDGYSARQLLSDCNNLNDITRSDEVNKLHMKCMGFISGVVNSHDLTVRMYKSVFVELGYEERFVLPFYCLPEIDDKGLFINIDGSLMDVFNAVIEFLETHPESWHEEAEISITNALREKYPCDREK